MQFRTIILALGLLVVAPLAGAQNAGLRVLSSNGLKAVLDDLRPQIERELGQPLDVEFGTTAGLRERIAAGEAFDVTILTTEAIAALARSGKIAAGSTRALGRGGIGVAVRRGAAKPSIRNTGELRAALLGAKSVTWVGAGAARGIIERMLATLGITAQIEPKVVLAASVDAANESVVNGHVEMVVMLASELLPDDGLDYLGPFPAEVQGYVSFAAGVGAESAAAAEAARLIAALRTREAAAVYEARGMTLASAP